MKKSELQQIIREEISKVLNENKDLIQFKKLIDDKNLKAAARLYYSTGAIVGKDAQDAIAYVKSKNLEKAFDKLDPDLDPAGGYGIGSHM
jgi:hypothetical protein